MDTKTRILKAALELFNKEGIEKMTVRHVAQQVGISHGNLCYHFPTINDIIASLYFELAAQIDESVERMKGEPAQLMQDGRLIFELLYHYRFLMVNFVDVMRRLPKVKKHYRELQARRKTEFKMVFEGLVKAGKMRAELYPGYFDDLIVNMTILGDFWMAHAEILYDGKEKEKVDYFYRVTSSLIVPLLIQPEKGTH